MIRRLIGWILRRRRAAPAEPWVSEKPLVTKGFRQPKAGMWKMDVAQLDYRTPELPQPRFLWECVVAAAIGVAFALVGLLPYAVGAWLFPFVFGMAQQTIDVDVAPDNRRGDFWRDSWNKVNSNFSELYLLQSSTLNAGTFPGDNDHTKIQNAINSATTSGAERVFIPASMLPFDAGLVVFNAAVHMVSEGTNFGVWDVVSYGANTNGLSNAAAWQAALNGANAAGAGVLACSLPGTYVFGSRLTLLTGVTLELSWDVLLDFQSFTLVGEQDGILQADSQDRITITGAHVIASPANNVMSFFGCNDITVEACRLRQGVGVASNTKLLGIYDNPVGAGTSRRFYILRNFLQPAKESILVQGRNSGPWTLEDVFIENNTYDASLTQASSFGIVKVDLQVFHFVVRGNIVNGSGLGKDGINVQENTRWGLISGNILYGLQRNGIIIEDGQSGGYIRDLIIEHNVINNIADPTVNPRGITLNYANGGFGQNIQIIGNNISNTDGASILENSTGTIGLLVHDNTCRDHSLRLTADPGIRIRAAVASVRGNYVASTATALSFSGSSTAGGLVEGNTFLSVDGTGKAVENLANFGQLRFGINYGFEQKKAFDTVSTYDRQDPYYIRDTKGTPAQGAYGAGMSFGRIGAGATDESRLAAISTKQFGTDVDQVGLVGWIHRTGTLGDPITPGWESGFGFWAPYFRDAIVDPAAFTVNTHNLAVGDFGWARIAATTPVNLTGIAAGDATGRQGRWLVLTNIDAFDITILHNSSASSDGNRILTHTQASHIIAASHSVVLKYDSALAIGAWRLIAFA